jgi:hypothetical protein
MDEEEFSFCWWHRRRNAIVEYDALLIQVLDALRRMCGRPLNLLLLWIVVDSRLGCTYGNLTRGMTAH